MAYERSVWESKLAEIASAGLLRERRTLSGPQAPRISLCGNTAHGTDSNAYLNFASNDYLGFANDPRIKQAAINALELYGMGSGASDVVCGHFEPHEALECELAEFTGRDKAVLFSSGYLANLAVIDAFCDAKSLVLQDKLNHASLIDGAKLSNARSQRYLHCSPESLETYLEKFSALQSYSQTMLVTDGVFSMDGDLAPLRALSEVADRYSALMAVDDAHGLGVLGEGGRGSLNEAGLSQNECPLLVGTFGKAFGTSGAFVAGPRALMDFFEQRARTHIYTTAMPPSTAAATRESLRLIESADEQREHLRKLICLFQEELAADGFELLASRTPIQGVVVGGNVAVMDVASNLQREGILVGAIRPPTVSPGSARLRITLTAAHRYEDVLCLVSALRKARDAGLFNG